MIVALPSHTLLTSPLWCQARHEQKATATHPPVLNKPQFQAQPAAWRLPQRPIVHIPSRAPEILHHDASALEEGGASERTPAPGPARVKTVNIAPMLAPKLAATNQMCTTLEQAGGRAGSAGGRAAGDGGGGGGEGGTLNPARRSRREEKMSIAQHHAAVKDYDRYVQCDREGCEKWHDAPQFRYSETFSCDMLPGQTCNKSGDWSWITKTTAFCQHTREDQYNEEEASFCENSYCEVAARHLLHNIGSRTPSFWLKEGIPCATKNDRTSAVDAVISMTDTAERHVKSGPERIKQLKKIFLAITTGVNQECKKEDVDWKRIDEQINEVCLINVFS